MSDYIHGSTDAREVARLEKQARFFGPIHHVHLHARPGQRVLDLATGVGAMAGELRRRFPDVTVVGVDLRRSQLEAARRNHRELPFVQGDGTRLPFADGSFDHVHCSWLLEHVPHPVDILREVRRVLRPGGEALFIEVDNHSLRTVPADPLVDEVMRALDAAQLRAGGDPYVGPKLEVYFQQAGFSRVEVWPTALDGKHADPVFFQALVEEFAEIFESLDEALGEKLNAKLHEAARRLRRLLTTPGGELHYRAFTARGTR